MGVLDGRKAVGRLGMRASVRARIRSREVLRNWL